MTWTTPALVVAGDTLTAAFWNAQVKGNLEHLATAGVNGWASYTPTWTAVTTNPTIGNGTLTGVYHRSGPTVLARMLCLAGSTTTFGSGVYSWEVPVTADGTGSTRPIGWGIFWDNSASGTYIAVAYLETTTTLRIRTRLSATTFAGPASNTSPVTWAQSDYLHLLLIYEAA